MKSVVAAVIMIGTTQAAVAQSAETYPVLSVDDGKMCSISLQMGGADWRKIMPPTGGEPGADIPKVGQAQSDFIDLTIKTIPVVSLTYDAEKTDDYRLHPQGGLAWPSATVYVYKGVWLKDDVKHQVRCVYEKDPWGLGIHTAIDDGAMAVMQDPTANTSKPAQQPRTKKFQR